MGLSYGYRISGKKLVPGFASRSLNGGWFQGFRVSGFQGFRVPGFQGSRVSGFQGLNKKQKTII
jgi:hypothetical protein